MISMKCPNCGHGLKIRDKYAGKAGRCRKCRTKFTVPEPSAEPIALSTSDEYDQPSLSEIDRRLESGAFDQLIHEEKAQAAEGATGAPPYPNFSFLYWVTTVIVPPLGLALALVAVHDHPQRPRAIGVSAFMTVVACLAIAAGAWLIQTGTFDAPAIAEDVADGAAPNPARRPAEARAPRPEPDPLPPADHASDETESNAPEPPSFPFLDMSLSPAAPIPIEDGALVEYEPDRLAYWEGSVATDYFTVVDETSLALRQAGWHINKADKMDQRRGMYSTVAAHKSDEHLYLQFIENPNGADVTVVTRR